MNTKYAPITNDGLIITMYDQLPEPLPSDVIFVELTEDQAALVQAGMQADPRVFYFYQDGQLLTQQQKSDLELEAFWASMPKKSVSAEVHIENQGYPAIRLVTLMDMEAKLAAANKSSAKLTAVRGWLDGILAAFAANPEPQSDWPDAPFGFEETVQDAALAL